MRNQRRAGQNWFRSADLDEVADAEVAVVYHDLRLEVAVQYIVDGALLRVRRAALTLLVDMSNDAAEVRLIRDVAYAHSWRGLSVALLHRQIAPVALRDPGRRPRLVRVISNAHCQLSLARHQQVCCNQLLLLSRAPVEPDAMHLRAVPNQGQHGLKLHVIIWDLAQHAVMSGADPLAVACEEELATGDVNAAAHHGAGFCAQVGCVGAA